jgi:hypothetical protein
MKVDVMPVFIGRNALLDAGEVIGEEINDVGFGVGSFNQQRREQAAGEEKPKRVFHWMPVCFSR